MAIVSIARGMRDDPHFYITMGAEQQVVLRISKVGLFQLGLAFYHVGMGNYVLDHDPEPVEVADLTVYQLTGC